VAQGIGYHPIRSVDVNLEFERAAELRDRLYKLREALFGVALPTET
jgi:excinuclease UvrABC helicase subunit UvrB